MNWKKVLPIVLAIVVVLGAACTAYFLTRPAKVGIAVHDLSDPATAEYVQLLQSRLSKEGYAVTVVDAKNDQSLQNQQLRTFIKEKYAAAIVSPVMISAITETMEIIKQDQLPVVFVGKEIQEDVFAGYDKAAYVGNPENQRGALLGNAVLNLPDQGDINGDGAISYLLVQDNPENVQKQADIQSMLQTLQKEDLQLKEIRTITTGGEQSESEARCAQSLAQFGKDIEVVICDSAAGALGADKAIQDGGRGVGIDVYLVAAGDTQQILKEIMTGKISAVIHRNHPALADKTAEVVKQFVEEKSPEKVNLVDYVAVTPENVVSYIIIE